MLKSDRNIITDVDQKKKKKAPNSNKYEDVKAIRATSVFNSSTNSSSFFSETYPKSSYILLPPPELKPPSSFPQTIGRASCFYFYLLKAIFYRGIGVIADSSQLVNIDC